MTRYSCSNERRLLAVKLAGLLNGIEYLEVRDTDETDPLKKALRQRTLYVRLLLPVPVPPNPDALTALNVVIDGGERIGTVGVQWAVAASELPAADAYLATDLEQPDHVLVVRTVERGDFSRYRFALVAAAGSPAPPPGFDPQLAEVSFSFKVECPSDFDCKAECTCPPGVHHAPPIDYLAKDYQGFRRIMLERMSLLSPQWTERAAADVGVTLVEMLAYVADELSYRQDAVATEAYLDTARSRVSLRRHARLVDYRMHDGCNARAWVRIQVGSPSVQLSAGTMLLSLVPGLDPRIELNSGEYDAALAAGPVVFETVDEAVLDVDLNEMQFWTWGEQDCCLPAGATSATLRGKHPALRAGDVVVLAETVSPTTGEEADADPSRRVAVRLVDVRDSIDPSGGLFPGGTTDVTEIAWHADDALPFPLCLGVVKGDLDTARVWGNIVLADHGQQLTGEDLGMVPKSRLVRVGDDGCPDAEPDVVPARYRPSLARRPLTQAVARPQEVLVEVPLTAALSAELATGKSGDQLEAVFGARDLPMPDDSTVRGSSPLWSVSSGGRAWLLRERAGMLQVLVEAAPAGSALVAAPRDARPALLVTGTVNTATTEWTPQPDLLASDRFAPELTVEIEYDGTAFLRFGDDEHGQRPLTDTEFVADYRVGNGVAGNVGRDALAHAVTNATVTEVSNPLPAAGGVEPESGDEVRRDAPYAFQVQERAVTEPDYAEVAERSREVQRAAATFRWTGSWHTAFVTADRFGGTAVDEGFETRLRSWLEKYRMAGYDLEVDAPVFVPLEIGLHVCVLPGHFRSDVATQVTKVLSDSVLPDGRLGLFHPDNLTFGQPVYLSAVLAAVHSVTGVQSVDVTAFQRQRQPQTSGLVSGLLPMGRLEIARLDNDPSFPERGVLDLTFGGGT
jgi:hypothetical protein